MTAKMTAPPFCLSCEQGLIMRAEVITQGLREVNEVDDVHRDLAAHIVLSTVQFVLSKERVHFKVHW